MTSARASVRRRFIPPDSVRMPALPLLARPAKSSSFGIRSASVLFADAEIAAVDLEVLGDGEVGIEIVDLGNDADANARRARRLRHRQADHLDRAAIGIDEAEAAAQRRRLAGAVRAEKTEALAAADREREATDDFIVAVALDETRDPQDDIFFFAHSAASARFACRGAPRCRPRSIARRRAASALLA